MFNRVLFPTDFSVYATAVLACLPELKPAGMREVILLGIIRPDAYSLGPAFESETIEKIQWSAEENLHIAQMALEGKGLIVKAHVEVGRPAAEIVRIAAEEEADLIAMGAQGKTLAQEMLLGSVAQEVVRHAGVPVLVFKFRVVRELGHVRCHSVCGQLFAHVLHPTDFSNPAETAFRVVKRLKAAGTAKVTVVHVQDERNMKQRSAEQIAEFDRHDEERLETMCHALRMFGLQAEPLLRHGIPFRETLRAAEETGAGLIVLGSHGKSAVREMLAGSTFENVVRLSRQAVLVIRPQ